MIDFLFKPLADDFNHVKPGLQISFIFLKPQQGRFADTLLLRRRNKFPGRGKFLIFPGLDFHKYDIPAIPGNEVNLSKPAEIVLPENRISLFL